MGAGKEVVVCATPNNIDLLFAAGEKVVGCEVKRGQDLIQSWQSRRLHRQLRTLIQAVDVAVLVLRDLDVAWLAEAVGEQCRRPDLFWGDWANWQTQGVYILPVPAEEYLPELRVYQAALATNGARVLAGTDRHKEQARQPGWLLRCIPDIGRVKSAALLARFGSVMAVLSAAERGEVRKEFGQALENKICRAIGE